MMVASSPRKVACTESTTTYTERTYASEISLDASTERVYAAADRAAAAAETPTAAAAMMAANAESTRVADSAADVALVWVEDIHANIKDTHSNIFQATSESNIQPTSKMVVEAMEHLLPHEIAERELKMQEVVEIDERQEEELRVA
ncbi:hypothetical protein ZWY2020_028493 [Hordeum vulgare]|nr:hypothetical protein ZWY2020_028493 [Hordeum vulgare]